jgi:hypothetical protein
MLTVNNPRKKTLPPGKAEVRAAFKRCLEQGMSLMEIAQLAGLDYQQLRNFSSESKQTIGPAGLAKLRAWLENSGRLGPAAIVGASESDPVLKIAAQLEALVPLLRDANFDYSTRLAFYREHQKGIERHLLPEAEIWANK